MRTCIALVLACLLIGEGLLPTLAFAKDAKQVKVNANSLNIRSGPGTDNPAVTSVTRGTLLDFVQQDGDWIQVRLPDGTLGWGAAKFLEIQDASAEPSTTPKEEKRKDAPPEPKPLPPPKKTVKKSEGGSAFGSVVKWGCLIGSAATAGIAFKEHSAGNDAYDEYEKLWRQGKDDKANDKFQEAEDHDSKATTFAVVSGGLFAVFLLQQFVFKGDGDHAASPEATRAPSFAIDPRTGEARASFVLARF